METLGQGTFGVVKKVEKKKEFTGEVGYFAMKVFKKSVLKRKREFYMDKDGSKL